MLLNVYRWLIIVTVLCTSTLANAANDSDEIIKAKAAFDKENIKALSIHTQKLKQQGNLLAPYAEYWLLRLTINDTSNDEIEQFISTHANYPFIESIQGAYLNKLGDTQSWQKFIDQHAHYQGSDVGVSCYAAEAYHRQPNTGSLAFAKPLWLSAKSRPNGCGRLFDQMQKDGIVDEAAIWQRFRLALGANRVSLATGIAKRSKSYKKAYQKLLKQASSKPAKLLKNKQASMKNKFGRELHLFALINLVKKDSWQGVKAFRKLEKQFNAEEVSYFYSKLALYAAKRHEPEAILWFQKANFNQLDYDQVSWYARTALRKQDWDWLLDVIEKMPADIAEEARWRYWKARALQAENKKQQAMAIFKDLAPERHYYGWLARDEVKNYQPAKWNVYKPKKEDIDAIGKLPGVIRARALFERDMRWEARREWYHAIKGFSDQQLLVAAAYANRQQWFDMAINTADKTKDQHDFSMRYLMPYRSLMKKAAKHYQVDETWVHGITRQESRFMHYAKSHAGAQGLMQLMPTTARWAAKRAGIKGYKRSMIRDLNTNVSIGTYYLSYTLNSMHGNKIMATAGYNAGPSRAKRWQAKQPLEGAIYAETIPFNETRVYVQRVMANTHMYAKQIGLAGKTLKQRMGTVPARSSR